MKYFVEESEYDFGNPQYIEVSEECGNYCSRSRQINMIQGKYIYHLYLLTKAEKKLLCAWFNYDSILDKNHWDDVRGIPKFLSPNEFHVYKPIMVKPFPNYIYAYDRGRKKDFSSPALLRVEDPEQHDAKWCLCKLSKNDVAPDNLLDECNVLLRYLVEMLAQFQNNRIDWKDRIFLNIREGIKDGIKEYIQPLSMLGDIYMNVDWAEIAVNDPNW